MASAPGLNPHNIRLSGDAPEAANDAGITVEYADDEGQDKPEIDAKGNIIKIDHPDGSVTISLDGSPLGSVNDDLERQRAWFANLVDDIDAMELGRVSEMLLRGITDDLGSRVDWIDDRASGMKLLGLTLEKPGAAPAGDGAPVEGMSKVRHPLLLEAVLRFQANAGAEMLPTDGPVKIRNDDNNADLAEDQLANAFERDLNHYLTAVATEYYPDTDRLFLLTGFGGSGFKKIYFCPLRSRPVSESVDATDLIVNNAATDLGNAMRVTHRIMMKPSTVKRMQILGVYRDVSLDIPQAVQPDAAKQAQNEQQGISVNTMNPDDRDREIYECYCELNLKGHEHKHKGKDSGLEIPYRVTLDVSSRQILSVVRNYNEDTKDLPVARKTFVKYTFVPGFGFYDIGLLHILGNTTSALTAAWRLMLDNGMFANFPGFLFADVGGRQNTNLIRVPPGGGAPIKTGGQPIGNAVMPLPYQTSGQAALQSLAGEMAQTGQRVGGTSELQVGEGRADAPVGTTLAMIDQAVKILNAVHKRMHGSQAEEFSLLVDCFAEHPESFIQMDCPSQTKWDIDTFMAALNNCNLVPRADPNTASQGQRMMKIMGLKQLQAANSALYDPIAVDTAALQALGWSNPQQFMVPPQALGDMPPDQKAIAAGLQIAGQEAAAKTTVANAKQAEVQAKIQGGMFQNKGLATAPPDPAKIEELRVKAMDIEQNAHDAHLHAENERRDRESSERMAIVKFAEQVMKDPSAAAMASSILKPGLLSAMQEDEGPLPNDAIPAEGGP